MDADRVDPELRAAQRTRIDLPVHTWWGRAIARGGIRLLPDRETSGVSLSKLREGALRVRIHRPDIRSSDAGLLWVHGGGLILGAAKMDDRFCGLLARTLGITVIAADYRLAPEHPYPAAHIDLLAIWDWVRERAHALQIDPGRVAVGGSSAGGGLAAALVLRLLDRGGPQPIAQWLFAPMLDDRTATRAGLDDIDHWVWPNRSNRFGWGAYLGAPPGAPSVSEYAAPARREDLRGLPPTWIGVGELDLFLDEDASFARRLADARVDVTLDVVAGAPHSFEGWAPEALLSRRFLDRSARWLAQVLRRTLAN